ncbi:MAG: T9SS type A sorting domain-containing protein [Bacteroidota bacterium]
MKKFILLPALLIAFVSKSQIVVDRNDMPNFDTIQLSTDNVQNFDDLLTGTSYTWDFSFLSFTTQRADTFVSVTSTPLVYNLAFNNMMDLPHKATIACQQADFSAPGGQVTFTNVFNYYQESDTTYKQVGFAANVNGAPVPIKYNDPELLFNFPLTMNDVDSSYTEYGVAIPTLGYYGQKRKRINTVDGWGTLITPYGTFDVWRVKSTLALRDTIYYDAMSIGFGFNRSETEVKWIGDNFGLPLLQINVTQSGARAVFIDSVRTNNAIAEYLILPKFNISPNPFNDQLKLKLSVYTQTNTCVKITDLSGRIVFEENISGMETTIRPNLARGAYMIHITGYKSQLLIRQ